MGKNLSFIEVVLYIAFTLLMPVVLALLFPLVTGFLDIIFSHKSFWANVQWWDGYIFLACCVGLFYLVWSIVSLITYESILDSFNKRKYKLFSGIIIQVVIGTIVSGLFEIQFHYWVSSFDGPLNGYLFYSIFLVVSAVIIAYFHYIIIERHQLKKFRCPGCAAE